MCSALRQIKDKGGSEEKLCSQFGRAALTGTQDAACSPDSKSQKSWLAQMSAHCLISTLPVSVCLPPCFSAASNLT